MVKESLVGVHFLLETLFHRVEKEILGSHTLRGRGLEERGGFIIETSAS